MYGAISGKLDSSSIDESECVTGLGFKLHDVLKLTRLYCSAAHCRRLSYGGCRLEMVAEGCSPFTCGSPSTMIRVSYLVMYRNTYTWRHEPRYWPVSGFAAIR